MTTARFPAVTDVQPGDFGLVPTYGNWRDRLAGWLIRYGTNSPVNHAFVYVGDGMIVEAEPGGARRTRLHYPEDTITWSRIHLTVGQRAEICQTAEGFAAQHVGYGWLDLVAVALAQHRLGRVVNPGVPLRRQPWWVRRVESLHTLICSQLVDACYLSAGARLFADGRPPGLVSPGDLYRLIHR